MSHIGYFYNQTSWLETIVKVEVIHADIDALVCLKNLKMKKLELIIALASNTILFSQANNLVKWMTDVLKISDKEVCLVTTANIQNNWHIYSQMKTEDESVPPIATTFFWKENTVLKLIENTKEGKGVIMNEPVLDIEIKCFYSFAMFKQRVRLLSSNVSEIKGSVIFMGSNNCECLPPSHTDLIFNIN